MNYILSDCILNWSIKDICSWVKVLIYIIIGPSHIQNCSQPLESEILPHHRWSRLLQKKWATACNHQCQQQYTPGLRQVAFPFHFHWGTPKPKSTAILRIQGMMYIIRKNSMPCFASYPRHHGVCLFYVAAACITLWEKSWALTCEAVDVDPAATHGCPDSCEVGFTAWKDQMDVHPQLMVKLLGCSKTMKNSKLASCNPESNTCFWFFWMMPCTYISSTWFDAYICIYLYLRISNHGTWDPTQFQKHSGYRMHLCDHLRDLHSWCRSQWNQPLLQLPSTPGPLRRRIPKTTGPADKETVGEPGNLGIRYAHESAWEICRMHNRPFIYIYIISTHIYYIRLYRASFDMSACTWWAPLWNQVGLKRTPQGSLARRMPQLLMMRNETHSFSACIKGRHGFRFIYTGPSTDLYIHNWSMEKMHQEG